MQFSYKNYQIKAHYACQTRIFYGEVLNHPVLISFQAASLDELKVLAIEIIESQLVVDLDLELSS